MTRCGPERRPSSRPSSRTRAGWAENVSGARLGLRLTPDEHEELKRLLGEVPDDFAARRSDGEPWSLFVGLHRDDRPIREPGADDRPIRKPGAGDHTA